MNLPTEKEMYAALEKRHGASIQKKLSNASVAVCGLGGLGSNITISLARLGIGKLILVDFDKVDLANLNRQQYAVKHIGMNKTDAMYDIIKSIMPYENVELHNKKITKDNINILSQADIICEAFDDAQSKAMLVNYAAELFPQKYIVCASGMAGIGCANNIITRKITEHLFVCGDGKSDIAEKGSVFSTGAMLCAAHQAHTVLRIITKNFDA